MAHYQQLQFVRLVTQHFPEYSQGDTRVLEVGSWIANDSVRRFFSSSQYVGADVADGPGVDLVCPGEQLEFADGYFDVVITCECFEHNPLWKPTFENMFRMLRPGGLFLLTCATLGRREHGTPRSAPQSSLATVCFGTKHYRNLSKSDLHSAFDLSGMFSDHLMTYNHFSRDLYFIGIKAQTVGASHIPVIPQSLTQSIRAISYLNPPSNVRRLFKTLRFWLHFGVARLLGEDRYHDMRFYLRTFRGLFTR